MAVSSMVWNVSSESTTPQANMNHIMTSAATLSFWRVVSTMADVPSWLCTNWIFTKAGTNVMKEIPTKETSENKGWASLVD
mmetsp:Transcript_25687/g.57561  ORF Transcript_25687/g.57561 Transcript_25687/m.57561 type:complete len:81 (+) Transcript_25687:1388-1630(+)